MNNFRLLSTKTLNHQQRERILQTGVSYTERNFISIKHLPFSVDPSAYTLIFTSQNAVNAVFNQLHFTAKKCYCVGEKTKALLAEKGQSVVKMEQNAADLADFILKNDQNSRFLFFAGKQRMPHLEKLFSANNKPLKVVEVYETYAQPKAVGSYDGLLFYSPSGVESFVQDNTFDKSICFALGNTTADALAAHTTSIITATQPTVEHLIAAVKKYLIHKL